MATAGPDHGEYRSRKYFSSLDAFRCGSILAVVWHHTETGVAWFPASDRGFLGVDMFFVISGFLIVTLLLRERERAGSISLRRFYARRALRIFPIYYGMLAVLAVYFGFVKPNPRTSGPFFADLPYQLFYMSDWIENGTILFFTWSLAAEEQFYVAWPPVEAWLGRAAVPILLGVIAVNQVVNFGLADGLLNRWIGDRNILQITFTPICLGVLLAHVLHSRAGFDRLAAWVGRAWMPVVLLAGLIAACNVPGDLSGWPRLLIQTLMTLLLASCVIREDHWLSGPFNLAPIRRIGVISYGMYMFHMFTILIAASILRRVPFHIPLALFWLGLALTVVVAELSYRFYETPFLRLKDASRAGLAPRRTRLVEASKSEAPAA